MVLVRILEGTGNGNAISFCNYNHNRRRGSRSIEIWISNEKGIGFWFSFWYMFGII